MANPSITARVIPDGMRLDNGYQSLVVFASNPTLDIWEKTVQPPAYEGGDPIETDTMLNVRWITQAPQCLIAMDEAVVVAAYDPQVLDQLDDLINDNQSITYLYPDGSAYAHWGYLRRAEFSPLEKGVQPEVTLTIVTTNWDPVNCVEAGPVFLNGTGSCNC